MRRIRFSLICMVSVALSFQACNEARDLFSASVMGEIVNPQTDYITILKNNVVVDSVPLDGNNQFFYYFDKSRPGFYTFRHNYNTHYETQMFYVEPGDSLQFRLNTKDFDNSLMYSGAGAAKNNFLMALFNENRENGKKLLQYSALDASTFKAKADSISENQQARLQNLSDEGKVSNEFYDIAQTLIDFGRYDLFERYLFIITRFRPPVKESLPSDFLAYRKTVNLNHEVLQTYYTYQYFLDDYLRNITIEDCFSENKPGNCFDLNSKDNLRRRLTISDSLFTLKSLRSLFLTRYGARLIVQSRAEDEVNSIVYFLKNVENYNSTELQDIVLLSEVQKRQFIGNVSHLLLAPYRGDNVEIETVLTKPTVFFYWSLFYSSHHQRQHQIIAQLQERLPYINFVGVNIDSDHIEQWEQSLKEFGYNLRTEFQLICPPEERPFYRNYLNKLVFVKPSGEIVNNSLSLGDYNLEEELIRLSKQ